MNYKETVNFLFNSAPLFQNIGKEAYKEGLYNTIELDKHFNHPHKKFKTIHVAGTNGKGSCSHTLAAILQSAGYKTGLYTSPHLVDFRERIKVNGTSVSESFVVDFVENNKDFFEPLHPSFFELATAMAFDYFEKEKVDVAIIEVGLGGRLDCTNIIQPDLSIITNISLDHIQFLGDTLGKIAKEKAGIIKQFTPCIIGESCNETKPVFQAQAEKLKASIIFSEESNEIISSQTDKEGKIIYQTKSFGEITGELGGLCQIKNTNTILHAIKVLKNLKYNFTINDVKQGFANVCKITGLMGRWQKLGSNPTIYCDTGHNVGGISYIVEQLKKQKYKKLRIVFGMVNDKDISGVLKMLPKDAVYYFTKAQVKRALDEHALKKLANNEELTGETYTSVEQAFKKACEEADKEDFIFVGGSSFIVADLLNFHF